MLRKRLMALIIDFCVTMVPYSLAVVIILLIQNNKIGYYFDKSMYILSLCFLIMSEVIFFSKDVIFKKRSIGKKIMNIKVVTIDGEEPKVFQLILRNITFFVWPLEIFLILWNKQRIGDILAKTRIVNM